MKTFRLKAMNRQIFFQILKLGSDEAIKQRFLDFKAMK
jgi:hypothetical protein